MKYCARAPVRVDPAGGGTDTPPFRVEHGGAVLNMAIQRHAFAAAQRLPAGSGVTIAALDLGQSLSAASIAALGDDSSMEFLKGFVRRLVDPDDAVLLVTEVDVPPGSGLGGSGALGIAVTAAIDGLYERRRNALETAQLANEIERVDLGYPGGDQDSIAAALGGVNFLEYHVGGQLTPHKVALAEDTLLTIEHRSLVVYTGAAHVSASIHEDILRSYTEPNSPTKQAMFNLQTGACAMREELEAGDIEAYGSRLNDSCRQLYQLHHSCDSDELRRYFDAIEPHVVGGKTCGAGGGGCIVVLTKPGQRSACIRTVKALGGEAWPVMIDQQGLVTWKEQPFDASFKQLL